MKKPKLGKDSQPEQNNRIYFFDFRTWKQKTNESANGLGVCALIMISRPKDEVEKRTFDTQIIVILGNSPFGRNC